MKAVRFFAISVSLAPACQSPHPSEALVRNDYPSAGESPGSHTAVHRLWWSVVLFAESIPAGESSDAARVVPDDAYAYALLAPDQPDDAGALDLIPVRSKRKLRVEQGHTLEIAVGSATFDGDCRLGAPLSQEDADFITQRIFPGEFRGLGYDAARCATTALEARATKDAQDAAADAVADQGEPLDSE